MRLTAQESTILGTSIRLGLRIRRRFAIGTPVHPVGDLRLPVLVTCTHWSLLGMRDQRNTG